jgi:hypothetical protein
MKLCPHCSAELRDSVIKCLHCGRSLKEAPEPAADASITPAPGSVPSPSTSSSNAWAPRREEKLGWWSPNPSTQPATEVVESGATERDETVDTTTDVEPDRAPVATQTVEPVPVARGESQPQPPWSAKADAWATRARMPEQTSARPHPPVHASETQGLRALPVGKRSSAHPDFLMLLAGAAAVAIAVVAWQAVAEPWVELRITDMTERGEFVLVGEMTIRGKGAVIGTIAQVLAGVIGALGVMWFLFGFDKGWSMPLFASPAVSIVTSVFGLAATVLSTMLWFVWEDAAIERARAVGKTPEALRDLLNQQPAPLVEIMRQPGVVRFGVMTGIGLVAACVAMAAANKRG